MTKNSNTIAVILIVTLFIGVILGVLFSDRFSRTTVIFTGRNNNSTSATEETVAKININTASADELSILPGLGTEISERIIAYRQKHGPFLSIDEITNVDGIGDKKFEAIKDYITVGG